MIVLVVDDSDSIRACLRDALEHAGHTVYCAGTMRAAMGCLEQVPLDAVIAGGRIPSYDASQEPAIWGPELTSFARRTGIRAVLFTADDHLVEAERKVGGLAVLKPGKGIGELLDLLERQP